MHNSPLDGDSQGPDLSADAQHHRQRHCREAGSCCWGDDAIPNHEPAPVTRPTTKRPRRMAREPKPETAQQVVTHAPTKRASKSDLVLALLQRPEGATIDQLVTATGWLPHTTRAALTGFKKKGHTVTSERVENQRHYRIACGAG